jgi:hypothetical protein
MQDAADPMRRNFGGIHFPASSRPPLGPLGQLARQFKERQHLELPSRAAMRLLAELPAHLRMCVLRDRHAAVLNRLAMLWHDPHALRRVIDELIFEGPGGQNRLSFEVIVELSELNEFVALTRQRRPRSVWDAD